MLPDERDAYVNYVDVYYEPGHANYEGELKLKLI